jgi:hypothetical protein
MKSDMKRYRSLSAEFKKIKSEISETNKVYNLWRTLKKVRGEYDVIFEGIFPETSFIEFVEANYGIRLTFNDEGNICPDFTIVDERKYLIFTLKYL